MAQKILSEDIPNKTSSASLEQGSTYSLSSPRKRNKLLARELNSCETQSVIFSTEDHRKELESHDQQFLDSLVQPAIITSVNGAGSCKDLFLPPAPAQDISHLLPSSKLGHSEQTFDGSLSRLPTSSKARQKVGSSSPSDSSSPQGKKKQAKTESQNGKVPVKAEQLLQPRRDRYCAPGEATISLLIVILALSAASMSYIIFIFVLHQY